MAFVIGLWMVPAVANAQPQVRVFRGKTVQAEFISVAGCITTTVTVIASDNASFDLPARDRFKSMFMSILQIDDCTSGDPIVQDTTGTLDNPNLVINWGSGTARLQGTILMEDTHNQPPENHQTAFDISWRAMGRAGTLVNQNSIEHIGDAVVITRAFEQRRAAVATGVVVQEDLVNLTPVPASDPPGTPLVDLHTFMSRILTGEVIVQRP
jgi:hypothetical protein